MKCPNCGNSKNMVVDSRPTGDSSIRRRRECLGCKFRFTTYEFIEVGPNFVIKKNGTREIFDRNKILTGLIKACYKRPVTNEQLENIVNEIEASIGNSLKHEIKSSDIGEMVMEKLKNIDDVSYVRFASVYRQFRDVDSFMKELSDLKDSKKSQ